MQTPDDTLRASVPARTPELPFAQPACAGTDCWCQTTPAPVTDDALAAELSVLTLAVDSFAHAMKAKLELKARSGRSGWRDPANLPGLCVSLAEHIERGASQAVDIANIAMMIWHQVPLDRDKAASEGEQPDWQALYLELKAAVQRYIAARNLYRTRLAAADPRDFDAIAEEFTSSDIALGHLVQ